MDTGKDDRPATLVAVLNGVREYAEGLDVELWRNQRGRLIVRAYNECGNAYTNVDLLDLISRLARDGVGGIVDCAGA
jgi:hypothetical protein